VFLIFFVVGVVCCVLRGCVVCGGVCCECLFVCGVFLVLVGGLSW